MKTRIQRPSHAARKLFVAAALASGFAAVADGATFNVSWDGGATGSYNTAVNWSTNTVPVNADVLNDYFNVTINRAGGAAVTANLSQIEVLNLTIGANAGNQLTLADNCTFGVIGTAAFGPTTVSNAGTIQLGVTAAAASQFNFLGSTTNLTGGGTISLIGANTGLFGNGTVTSNNTIIGFGEMGLNSLAWVNNATVTASGGSLTVDMGTGGFDNNGLMQSIAGGTLVLSGNGGGTFANAGGTIANNGGRVQLLDGVTIAGGTIQSLNLTGSSIFFVPGTHTATLSNLTSAADVNVATGGTLNLTGTITNNGRIRTNNSAGTATFNIGGSTVTLSGSGSLNLAALAASAGNVIGTGTLINGATHSIFGAGTIGDGSTTIRNDGLIDANLAGATLTIRPDALGNGLINSGTLQTSAGTLIISAGQSNNTNGFIIAAGGTVVLDSADISGGTLQSQNFAGTSLFIVPSGASSEFTGLVNNADVVVNPGAQFTLVGNITNNGVIRTNTTGGAANYGILAGTTSLLGTGSLLLSGSGLSDGVLGGIGTLVNGSSHSIIVAAGEGTLGDGSTTIRNNGTLSLPNGSGAFSVVGNGLSTSVFNAGTMTTSSPLFTFGSAVVSNSGTIQALAGGDVNLRGSSISGGTINIAAGGAVNVSEAGVTSRLSSGTLLLSGDVNVSNGATISLDSMFVENNGAIRLGLGGAADVMLISGGTTTLAGGGLVLMNTTTTETIAGTGTLNNLSNTIAGTGTIGLDDLTVFNDGTILASGTGGQLTINTGAGGLTNTGVVRSANGATLRIRDTNINNANGEMFADAGNIELFNGTSISGGTLNAGTALFFVPGSGTATLSNLTSNAPISISSAATGTLVLGGTITNQHTIRAAGNAVVNVSGGTTTLLGAGSLSLDNTDANHNVLGNGTLVNGATHRIVGRGNIGGNTLAVRNLGSIDANFAGGTLTIDPGAGNVNTSGTLAATAGTMVLTGAGGGFFSNTGTVSAAGGTVLLAGGASVGPGTIRSNPGSSVQVASGQTGGVAGVTNLGDLGNSDGTLTLNATITNNGTITVGGGAEAATVSLLGIGAALNGTGQMTLGAGGFGTVSVLGAGTLTNGPTHLISGRGSFGSNDLSIVNSGTMSANLALQTLVIDPDTGNLTNSGTIQAVNGGTVHLVGGNGGVFNNTGTLRTRDQFSRLLLIDATVNGGTLDGASETSNFLGVLGSTGTINNATNIGVLSIVGAGTLNVGTAITNTGHVFLQSNPGGAAQVLLAGGTVNFTGAGSVHLNQSGTFQSLVGGSGTLVSSTQILGRGLLGNNAVAIHNSGTIAANQGGQRLTVDPNLGHLTNNNVIQAINGGILTLTGAGGGSFANNGVIQIVGSGTVELVDAVAITGGTLTENNVNARFTIPPDESASLRDVFITNGSKLFVSTNSTLQIGGTNTNNGLIAPGGGGNDYVTAAGTTTLGGNGTVILGPVAGSTTLTIGGLLNSSNLLRGHGLISGGTLVNSASGVVSADQPGRTLLLVPGTLAQYQNHGHMGATNGGILELTTGFVFGGAFANIGGGSMTAEDGSVLRLSSTAVFGGSLHTTGSGTVDLNGSTLGGLVNNGHLVHDAGTFTIGTLVTNNGRIDSAASGTIQLSGLVSSALVNNGTLAFAPAGGFGANLYGIGSLTNTGLVTGPVKLQRSSGGAFNINNTGLMTGSIQFSLDGAGTHAFDVVNSGTVRAQSGEALLIGAGVNFAGTGTIDIDSGAAAVGAGTVVSGTTLVDGTATFGNFASLGRLSGTGLLNVGTVLVFPSGTVSGTVNFTHSRVENVVLQVGSMKTDAGGGTLGTSRVTSLVVQPGMTWDLTDHDLVVDYTVASPLPAMLSLIQSGHAGGAWTGTGLTSSAAAAAALTSDRTGLGYAEAGELFSSFPQQFSGQTIDSTTFLVKYTLLGDANLSGAVDIDDFGVLASNFNTTGRWNRGDFNYSGTIDIDDFGLLAANFNKALASGSLSRGGAVPEPSMAACVVALLAGLKWRPRRGKA